MDQGGGGEVGMTEEENAEGGKEGMKDGRKGRKGREGKGMAMVARPAPAVGPLDPMTGAELAFAFRHPSSLSAIFSLGNEGKAAGPSSSPSSFLC
jgi:hypothetical protein